ncbi:MAG: hypothetical protein ACTSQE_01060 [Candidatus Heimdallarchaeaceae archaeon]
MSTKTIEFKFIHYEPEYSDIEEVYSQYYKTLEEFKKLGEENITARVLSYFYEGLIYIINADQLFKAKEYEKALDIFENGHKLIVRSRASRGREGDEIWHEMIKWIYYSEAYLNICKSFLEEDLNEKLTLIQYGISNIKLFIEQRKREKNYIDVAYAKSRLHYMNYIYYHTLTQKYQKNTRNVKKLLIYARSELLKAHFIFHSFDDELEKLDNLIDDLTKKHIVERAERFWDKGTMLIAQSNFMKAHQYFAMASQYYERASKICSDFMELRLYLALSKITKSSSIEAQANELYRRKDQPKKASSLFVEAYKIVDESLGLLASINNEILINSMTAQRSYYEALSLETEGIAFFDKEKYKEAIKTFEEAMKKLEETDRLVTDSTAEHLKEYIRLAKNEIEGYLSMAKAML